MGTPFFFREFTGLGFLGLWVCSFCVSCAQANENGRRMVMVPALFVFGDSLLDTGNNNNLSTLVRASSPPYGHHSLHGRFADALITTDFIASMLGLPSPPPFMSCGENVLHGVNFASGGSGILDSTGDVGGQHISMWRQIRNFQEVKSKLIKTLGRSKALKIIANAVYYSEMGGNDYLLSYYTIPRNLVYGFLTPNEFEELVVSTLLSQLKRIYKLGGRKFVVSGLPILGCAPSQTALYRTENGSCVGFLQDAAKSYNQRLLKSLQDFQAQLKGAHFTFNNIFDSALQIYQNPEKYGIRNVKRGCCGGSFGVGVCFNGAPLCRNASQYFFDGFHPTSRVHQLVSLVTFAGGSPFVNRWNLKTLASLPQVTNSINKAKARSHHAKRLCQANYDKSICFKYSYSCFNG